MADVSIAAALVAGMLSFLSPCVLPLVPPYLVYLTGTSLEHFATEPKPQARHRIMVAALLFVLGFSTVFVALGAGASAIGGLLRAYSYGLSMVAGVMIIIMGLHFLGITPIAWLMQEKRAEFANPVGLWGAYVMGLGLCLRLDAVHRADPRGDPCGRSIRSDGGERGGDAGDLFARSRHSVPHRRLRGRVIRRLHGAASGSTSARSRRPWAAFWCSPASPSSPAS